MSSEPRSRRRWLQFSIRSMFVVSLVAASFCAGVTYQREVQQRLRAELEQAKVETEDANRRVVSEQWNARIAWANAQMAQLTVQIVQCDVEKAALEIKLKAIKSGGKTTQEDFDATIKTLRLKIKAALAAGDGFNSSGGPFAPRLIPTSALPPNRPKSRARTSPLRWLLIPTSAPGGSQKTWKQLFRDNDGKPSFRGDDVPIPKPKPPSSFEFDQPLLDRAIG